MTSFSSLVVPDGDVYSQSGSLPRFQWRTVVDFQDLALLASSWGSIITSDANSPVSGLDLNADGCIDLADLSLFGEYWLERTDCGKPVADVNSSPASL